MDISQLRMFKTVAEMGSIVRASEVLHCVPSNITTRLKLLEDELGVSLFVRRGRGLIISPSGNLFLDYAVKILSLCDEAKRSVQAGASPSGILRLGAIESSATGRMPRLLSAYHQAYPAVRVCFGTGTWSELLSDVLTHRLDGAIVAVRPQHPKLNVLEVYQEQLVLIAPSTFGAISSPEDIVGKNIFMWPEGCPYRKALETWISTVRESVSILSIASYGTILGCVSAGAGISLVPRGVFEQFHTMGGIKGYFLSSFEPMQNYFIWHKATGVHRAQEAFVELLRREFEQ